ncbi:hypothetical protein ACFL6U_15575 [Planctomycetota bacterium]
MAWMLYCDEFNGNMPGAQAFEVGTTVDKDKAPWIRRPVGYTPVESPIEDQIRALEVGVMFPFVKNSKVYRCPVAKPHEMRSYSVSHAMNGVRDTNGRSFDRGPVLKNRYKIKRPAERIVFVDDIGEDWDAAWALPWSHAAWGDGIPARHGSGTVFGMADGRSEWWAWRDSRTIKLMDKWGWTGRDLSTIRHEGNPDLVRVQRAIWGNKLGYMPQ